MTGGRRPVVYGVLGFWLAAVLLRLGAGVPLLDAILLALILAVFPAFAVAQAGMLEELPFARLPAYWSSIATLWLIGATSWLAGTRDGGLAAIGIVWTSAASMVGWTAALTALGVGAMVGSRVVGRALGIRETPILERMLPRTREERRVFAFLSVAAGVGEEVAYRGYALLALSPALGTTGALVVTSAVFGVLHAYQGAIGIVRTGLMGAVLAGGFLMSGSLVPAILAHVLIDLIGGLVIADHFRDQPEAARTWSLAETTPGDDE